MVAPPLEDVVSKNVQKRIRKESKYVRLYLVRYRNRPADEDEWLEEKDIPDAEK